MQFASKLGRVLCRTLLFFSRTNGPNLSVRSLESSAYPYERSPWFQMLSSPATRWASNQLIRRKTASSFLFFFWDTVDFRRARLLRKRTTARGLIRRMGLGRGTFFIYSLFLFLPWQTLSLYPLHRYTMMNYELSTFGLFLSKMRKFLVLSWPGALSI